MPNKQSPKLKFSPIFFTLIIAIAIVVVATLWPILDQQKTNNILQLQNLANDQSNELKALLKPVVKTKNVTRQTAEFNKALKAITPLWEKEIQLGSNKRLFLIKKGLKTSLPKIVLDKGVNNIDIDEKQLQSILSKALNESKIMDIPQQYFISISPIIDDQFGLLVLQKQPTIIQQLQKIAPYTGFASLIAILFAWLAIKFWKSNTLNKVINSQARYKQLVESTTDWIWETDQYGNLTYSSHQSLEMLGYQPQEIIGKPIFKFLLPENAEKNEKILHDKMGQRSDLQNLEMHFKTKSKNPVMVLVNGKAFKDDSGKLKGYRGINRNITEQKKRQDNIINMAFFDSLTQLPNRANLIDQLNHHLAEVIQRKELLLSALLFIDLDGFKEVNDYQGHDIGDQLLKEISNRMQNFTRQHDTVFRLGGDEFVILIRCTHKILMPEFKALLNQYTKKLLEVINQPLVIDSHNIMVSGSIGVALIPQDGRTPSEILSHADSAMYLAKHDGKNCSRYFDASMQELEDQRKQIANDIKRALENNEFELHYQLQIDSNTQKIYGMEALIRWRHPTQNRLISPIEFLDIAMEANHIQAIDEWVIKQAATDLHRLQKVTHRSIPVSINLSAKILDKPDLTKTILNTLEDNYLAPSDFRIEITETSLLQNMNSTVKMLEDLRDKGVKTSIDDFGTGYSSLSYLQALPIDTLKIDKSFIDKITTSNQDFQICRSIIQLAQTLDKTIIAEGVSIEEQESLLADEGCFIIQGYLHAKPQSISTIIQQLSTPINSNDESNSPTQTEPSLKLINNIN